MTISYSLELCCAKPILDTMDFCRLGRHHRLGPNNLPGKKFDIRDKLWEALRPLPDHHSKLEERLEQRIVEDFWNDLPDPKKDGGDLEITTDEDGYWLCAKLDTYTTWERRDELVQDIEAEEARIPTLTEPSELAWCKDHIDEAMEEIASLEHDLCEDAKLWLRFLDFYEGCLHYFDEWVLLERWDADEEKMEYDFVGEWELDDKRDEGWVRFDPQIADAEAESITDAVEDALDDWHGAHRDLCIGERSGGWDLAKGSLEVEADD